MEDGVRLESVVPRSYPKPVGVYVPNKVQDVRITVSTEFASILYTPYVERLIIETARGYKKDASSVRERGAWKIRDSDRRYIRKVCVS